MNISERLFRLIVRFYFGALLAISLYLGSFVAYYLILNIQDIGRAWVPIIFTVDLFFITACCLFAKWQWHRLPGKWWMVIIGTAVSGSIVFGLMYWASGGRL
ncbi:MAG TPA: hypothetical protein PLN21_14735 [Gemmatales bacterium]|nr:hypothetical protein [Gemmatales bacterium]